jgi:MFS family permease
VVSQDPSDRFGSGGFAPLASQDFRRFLLGFVSRETLMPFAFITQIFWVQEHAPEGAMVIAVGAIGTLRGTALFGFGLFGGALADRFERRSLLIGVEWGLLAVSLGVGAWLAFAPPGALGLAGFLALVFVWAALFAIDGPARLALIPDLVGAARAPAALALFTGATQLTLPVSILASGFVIDGLGFAASYALTAVGHALDLLLLRRITVSGAGAPAIASGGARRALRDVGEGLVYTRGEPLVLATLAVLGCMFALGFPAVANLGPTWITTVVKVPVRLFGLVGVTWGLGALLASAVWTRWAHFERRGALVVGAGILFGLSFLVFALARTASVAALANLGLGSAIATGQIASISLLQHRVPNQVRGRVMSLVQINMGVAQLLTLPIAAVGEVLTLPVLFPILAGSLLLAVAAVALLRPALWHATVPHPLRDPAAA